VSRYKPYPKYKESGVEWLGEVPEHWEVKKLKHILSIFNGGAFPSTLNDQLGIPLLKMSNIKKDHTIKFTDDTQRIPHHSKYSKFLLSENDIVVGLSGSISNLAIVKKENLPCYLNQRVCRFTNLLINRKYLFYYLSSNLYTTQALVHALGNTIDNLSTETLKTYIIPLPSNNEQANITKFLDKQTRKIDTLIAKQEQLIELLQEKRQALISHTVTKGLNPNVKLKDSGIEWIGKIPVHWRIPKIKYFAITDSGATPASTHRQEYYENGTYPWIRTTDLNNGELISTPIKITKKAIQDTACNIIPKGSILIGMYGGAGTIGKHALLKFPSTINQAVCAITPNKQVLAKFLHYTIQFYRPYWMIGAMGTRKDPNIGQDTIQNRHLPIPPLKEQQQIADYLDTQTAKIDTLIEKAKQAIELLKERREALISAAVTGKIDLREESL